MLFTLIFGDYTFPNQTFEVSGFPLSNDVKEESILRKDGGEIQTPFLSGRSFKVRGIIHNSTKEASQTELDAMQAGLLAGEYNFQDRSDRVIKARVKKIKADQERGSNRSIYNISVDFLTESPFFVSSGLSVTTSQALVGGTTVFDVGNIGNVYNEPQFYFYASGATVDDNLIITNLSNNNQQMRFRGTIGSGLTLEIRSETLQALNNSVDGISYFEGSFLNLVAGTNSLQYEGDALTFSMVMKPRWY